MDHSHALATLDAIMPAEARRVCERLSRAGYQALAVGGAVRDAILGRTPGDWDVATDASPEQVAEVFPKTLPTGVQHGTVTVLEGRGDRRLAIEVTTFRGEGAYTDGRRPDSVVFGVPLHEDLARRDLVINAMAYDPIAGQLHDPFGGHQDIVDRRIRAVGDPAERFHEDGLRVMRAIRFAAVLAFDLDAATEAAIPGALPVLAKVSRERVRDELMGILRAERPSLGLTIAWRTGVIASILPELADDRTSFDGERIDAIWPRVCARVDAVGRPAPALTPEESVPDPMVRLAALLVDVGHALPVHKNIAAPLRRLKLSNAEMARVDRLVRAGVAGEHMTDMALRQLLGHIGRARVGDLLALWRADIAARPAMGEHTSAVLARVQTIIRRGDALSIGELALTGGELIGTLGLKPGRAVGELLRGLFDRVLDQPALNTPEALLELARGMLATRSETG